MTSTPPSPPEGAPARTTLVIPPQWPAEVTDQYEPLRQLGQGGFATVVLARQKKDTNTDRVVSSLVAIKVVGSQAASRQEHGYAHREIDILQELQHPNIMKIMDFWEAPPTKTNNKHTTNPNGCAAVMALSYSQGPTLEHLLKHGGAVSLSFGRVVMAQLVDAIAYCHGRAVIHRDIKPDNVVITGASASQDEIWNDCSTDKEGDNNNGNADMDWKKLRQKWHVTVIDFGFARALSPSDIEKEKVTMKSPKHNENDTSLDQSSSSRRSVTNSSRHSVSHVLTRKMSALGNRMYAAPEIVNGVQNGSKHGSTAVDLATSRHIIDITKTLSHHVSNYGMLADAFSLGNTLQYMMTGVPPNQNVMETIRNHRSPLMVLCRYVAKHCCSSAAKTTAAGGARTYQYRTWSELPPGLVTVIRGMNHPSVSQRISVRAARRYPCVEDVFGDDEDEETLQHCTPGRIDFLQCVLKDHQEKKLKPQPPKPTPLDMDENLVEAVPIIDETIVQDDQVGLEL